ncbi:diphosphomevalonate decarboxylase [Ligilactobacillus ceti]|uniref:diphosphomevalonate decarboxylase n=1 Tax=Ligilactobacillus ceti DSM 22408 TaxID=1122146 RepID=A0A0R2KGZ3_9LACO|nr:diphosphomevalonate decarboxylase [Ligilactobacillus ceti]KRN88658.1 diphosphomevalonate decarboxylase [Ligilactobacillus ceti DSM 22408]
MKSPKITARAHTNIALIKYWGKKNQELIIPMNNSLSLTLDHFYTDTTVQFDSTLTEDIFTLDGKTYHDEKVSHFMDIVRDLANISTFAKIDSTNHVPTMAGLASSASAYAALALAASQAAGLNLDRKDLSRLARRGSGSASRSIYGGFVEWQAGTNDLDSYAVPFEEDVDWDLQMIAIVLDPNEKKISSRAGMQTVVATSPYYPAWVESTTADLTKIKTAIQARDFTTVGEIAESNAMKMHALNMSATPHFSYIEPDSIKVMDAVAELRAQGIPCYYTMDAGPNVKIICQKQDTQKISDYLTNLFAPEKVLVSAAGPGAKIIARCEA